jgi:hypothetical protein
LSMVLLSLVSPGVMSCSPSEVPSVFYQVFDFLFVSLL